mmetsp:Transcript_10230/g.24998  ORF Transcript_10230/g.24998 Transcript_10230/m.24998 type:complete len:299 (-) Transcript_10230:334-1230(-)
MTNGLWTLLGVLLVATHAGAAGVQPIMGFGVAPMGSVLSSPFQGLDLVKEQVGEKLGEVWTQTRRSIGVSDELCCSVSNGVDTLSKGVGTISRRGSGAYEELVKIAPIFRTPWRRARDEQIQYEQRSLEWRVQEAFYVIDVDLGGSISITEMQKALSGLGVKLSTKDIARMIRAVDENDDCELNLQEWKHFVGHVLHKTLEEGGKKAEMDLAVALGLDMVDENGHPTGLNKDRLSSLVDVVELQNAHDREILHSMGIDEETSSHGDQAHMARNHAASAHKKKLDVKSHKSGLSGNLKT